tara:strand:+ start:1905 stop:2270 length:366 start_codon:yes stop_codon:yes gene_type:complete
MDLSVLDLNGLKNVYRNIDQVIKRDSFSIDLVGMIDSKRLAFLSEEFDSGEVFRVNFSNDRINNFKTISKMSRISIKYLDNIDKLMPSRNQAFNLDLIEEYKKYFKMIKFMLILKTKMVTL